MAADWTIVQGDTAPVFEDHLTLADGTIPSLSGASLQLVMRSPTAAAPLTLTGTAAITSIPSGAVRYSPSAGDTAAPGRYLAAWRVTFPDGSTMTFPTVGYLTVDVEPNLMSVPATLVSLSDVKEHLGIPANDRNHDARLMDAIKAVRPVVENITGPIVQATFDERHYGGGPFIQVRRRPSSTYDTTPVLTLLTATEDLGTQTYNLTVVTHPSLGTNYSAMIDPDGTVTRLTGGGGQGSFAGGADSVHITYMAGQSTVPANVTDATLELIRANYGPEMAVGQGRVTVADDQDTGVPLGFFVSRRVREMLAPNRRAPAVG